MNNSNNEISVTNSTFYPEKIIFCIDISGEMNKILEFNDLPFPAYNNVESDFQTQKLSVPNSPNHSPMTSPPLPPRALIQTQEPISDLLNLNDDFNSMAINNNTINNDGFNSVTLMSPTGITDSNITNFNNNNNFGNNYSSLYKMNYDGEKDDNGHMSDNSRSSTPIKNFLKGNNDNSNIESPDNRKKSNSSLNFLKSNFPSLKQPVEITRLEAVKRYVKRFVSLKGSLCKDHQYAFVLLGVDSIWFSDFTSDYKNIINVMEEIPAQEEYIRNFGMDSLFNLLKERNLIPNILTSTHLLRIIFLYSRPTIPTINIDNPIFKQLQESKLFMFDCIYFHDKKSESFNPQSVFNELLKMEDPSNPSLFFDVIRNGQKFSIAMMKLIGHPLQRKIK
ncbi:hypothetical protein LY90DRAFT_674854 [Neocallimastix californiae]|uniref:BRISC and BRCA1-A complex member 1 n=1 Tax=Neocallimastix californiae TaxID=1754190 RepID=A0A1Y2AS81_9FUNG|nr:hypothetical protein LY90DRAFT_674854 [Neocallimastix californiae]|eukprot:ORY25392.1 hypothetical protein LY90DRAFT_674854 [Neocallimastix californiae]